MAPLIAAAPTIFKVASAGFSIFKGIRSLTSSRANQPSAQGVPPAAATPQVADDTAARKRRRIGRNALIFTEQEDILGNPTITGRNRLIAF